MSNLPALTFFVELDPPELAALFNDEHMIEQLKTMSAHLSIGLKDLSPERAAVIKKLNGLDIPVTAWLLLPHSQGYWFNLDNIDQAERRYEDFLVWTKQFSLKWDRVGLDIEPDIHLVQSYKDGFWSGLKYAARRPPLDSNPSGVLFAGKPAPLPWQWRYRPGTQPESRPRRTSAPAPCVEPPPALW